MNSVIRTRKSQLVMLGKGCYGYNNTSLYIYNNADLIYSPFLELCHLRLTPFSWLAFSLTSCLK